MAEIVITHTRADGTLLRGSEKGDGVLELVRPYNFRFFRSLGCLGIPRSRDRRADTWRIDGAVTALREAGHEITVTIDEDQRRHFADAEAERVDRAEARAQRYEERAEQAADRSDSLHTTARDMASRIPFGQPILIGHHSEGRDRRFRDRIGATHGKAVAEGKRAAYYEERAAAAAAYEAHRNNPAVTLRRIDRLEATRRLIERRRAALAAAVEKGTADAGTVTYHAELDRRHDELSEEIAYWRQVIAAAEADGVKIWGPADFTKGDFARIGGRWYEVLRVNARSLTVPGGPDIRPVVTAAARVYSWNDRAPYDGVTGRMSAEEMRRSLDTGEPRPGA